MTIKVARPEATSDRHGPLGVVAADADPLARLGLQSLVEQTPAWRWLGCTGEARGVLLAVARLRPDVLLLDSALDRDGSLIHALRMHYPTLGVALVVRPRQQHSDAYLRQARQAGAIAALPRHSPPAGLLEAVRQARVEGGFRHSARVEVPSPTRPEPDDRPALSPREQDVVRLIATGLNNEDIGLRLEISTETVRTHVKRVLRKLDARDRAHAIARAYTLGVLSNSLPEPVQAPPETPVA